MSVRGFVRNVSLEPRGTEVTAALGPGLAVEWPGLFDDGASVDDPAYLSLNDTALAYVAVDDDTSIITLAASVPLGTAVGDRVYVITGDQIAVDLVAYVDTGDGPPAEVIIPFDKRDLWPEGDYNPPIQVTLSDDLERILTVPGRLPARHMRRSDGVVTTRFDSATGEATLIGEYGSAPPGEIGVFIFSNRFSYAGAMHTRPVVQLNTGASRDQPSIQADSGGGGAGIEIYSGASTLGREAKFSVDQGEVYIGIEKTADDGLYAGSHLNLKPDLLSFQTDTAFDGSAWEGLIATDSSAAYFGYYNPTSTNRRGFVYDIASNAVFVFSGGTVQFVSPAGTAYQDVQVSNLGAADINYTGTLTHVSDASQKTDVQPAPDGMAIIRSAPATEWSYVADPTKRHVGPMANDLPEFMVSHAPAPRLNPEDEAGPDILWADLTEQVGVMWAALGQADTRIAALERTVADLTARLDQKGSA